jgi:hypothetical protein
MEETTTNVLINIPEHMLRPVVVNRMVHLRKCVENAREQVEFKSVVHKTLRKIVTSYSSFH